jgi:hypothetical protein
MRKVCVKQCLGLIAVYPFLLLMRTDIGAAQLEPTNLLARYLFQTNGNDCLGKSAPFVLTNSTFTHEVLFVQGSYASYVSAPSLNIGHSSVYLGSPILSDLDYRSFTVGFDFYPVGKGVPKPKPLLNRFEKTLDNLMGGRYRQWFARGDWGGRNILTGGISCRWLGFNRAYNHLTITLNNQDFTHEFTSTVVEPNRWHHVICSVNLQKKRILTWFDGRKLDDIMLSDDFKLDVIGSKYEETDREFTFINFSNGSVFYGYAADLKIFNQALTEAELAAESTEAFANLPGFPLRSSPFPIVILIPVAGALLVAFWILWRIRERRSTLPS